jgi:hypothetical protein
LHLVGILFPHIIDDARSKPHQIVKICLIKVEVFCNACLNLDCQLEFAED